MARRPSENAHFRLRLNRVQTGDPVALTVILSHPSIGDIDTTNGFTQEAKDAFYKLFDYKYNTHDTRLIFPDDLYPSVATQVFLTLESGVVIRDNTIGKPKIFDIEKERIRANDFSLTVLKLQAELQAYPPGPPLALSRPDRKEVDHPRWTEY